LSQPNTDSTEIKDERWAIRTFRPLLQILKVQDIPTFENLRIVYMADRRNWIIQGMGRCIVAIEQHDLPGDLGGMLITSHDSENDYFKLHILIKSSLCNKTTTKDRALLKITAIHEFTHIVAALSAIARIRSKPLIQRLKEIFREKVHAISCNEIQKVADELRNSFFEMLENIIDDTDSFEQSDKNDKAYYFPDNHFRLGFEDFPVSYPVIFEEFLLSREMFDEYFPKNIVDSLCKAFDDNNSKNINDLLYPPTKKLIQEKALEPHFAIARVTAIFMSIYSRHLESNN